MAHVITIDGARGRGRIPAGECRCVPNRRTHRGVRICKTTGGKTRIKGAC